MPWPKTLLELAAEGYTYLETKSCRGKTCKADILWFKTPQGRLMPISLVNQPSGNLFEGEDVYEAHFAKCPDVQDFRKKA